MNGHRAIRVLHLGSPTGLYGAERWILALVKHLPQPAIESTVGVIKDDPRLEAPLCDHAAKLGLPTRLFEAYGKLSLPAVGQLRRFVTDNGIDIVHTHGYKTDIIGCLAVRGTRCRIICTPHGWSTDAGLRLQLYESLDRIAFLFVDAVVPLSQDLYDGLARVPGLRKKLHLIQNGVDLSDIDAVTEPAPELGSRPAGEFLVGYVGQLIARKGIDTLIHAFQRLPMPDKRLLIVGDGPLRPALESLAAELGIARRVELCGFREDRLALMQGLDVFVLPSSLEGIPRCLLEAMAAGVPVVATDIPGCRGLVRPDETGLLFAVDDVQGLASALSRLALDPDLGRSLGRAGRALVRAQFSAETMACRYAELYRALTPAAANKDRG